MDERLNRRRQVLVLAGSLLAFGLVLLALFVSARGGREVCEGEGGLWQSAHHGGSCEMSRGVLV